jgi:phosphoglycolate phosphatase-like HAD superfamily hydrolase
VIRGIVLDKDGTLVDFRSLWDGVGRALASEFLRLAGIPYDGVLEAELSGSIGVLPGGLDPGGAFASGTYAQCGDRFVRTLSRFGFAYDAKAAATILAAVSDRAVCGKNARYVPTCDLRSLFSRLRRLSVKTALVTADTQLSAEYAADRLAFRGLIDFLAGATDSEPPKPDGAAIDRFCAEFGLSRENVAVVGDTPTDMRFARNAGAIAVGVLSGVSTRKTLAPLADYVIDHAGRLPALVLSLKERR